ncbi:MAG: M56 family metallopeptidase [Oscillospiraceae bacterium]|nr:M56 family metallopeptidase [Oscillospiraceae bacterium]
MTADAFFLLLLHRSLAASWLILALLLFRPFLRRVSRSLCCAMWGLVAFRLLCPFSFESAFSLLPGSGALAEAETATAFPGQELVKVAAAIWLAGVLLLGLYTVGSYWHLRYLVQEAVKKEDGVWLCDRIDTPFILGVFRPRILLPFSMDAEDIPYVLAHERAHLARRDHWRKPIAFALLTVFWFQPVLWIAYVLLGRDIEFACDERTVRALGGDDESKARYAKALLRGSVPRVIAAKLYCPLAFGGLQTRQRVQSVLNYRKPAMALLLAAAVVCISVAVCFLTDPKGGEVPEVVLPEPDSVLEASDEPAGEPPAESPKPNPVQVTVQPGKEVLQSEIRQSIESSDLSNRKKEQFYTCLSHMRIEFFDEKKPYMAVIENTGDADGSITFWVRYMTYDQDVLALPVSSETDFFVDVKIVTILLPAGETVFYTFDPGYEYTARHVVVAGVSYAELSVTDYGLTDETQKLYKG